MSTFESRFTAFEELFLLRDRIDAPSSFFVKIELREPLDQTKAAAALDVVCELHPLARSSAELLSGPFFWTFEETPTTIQWNDCKFREVGYPTSWFDSMCHRPLKVSCFRGESGGTTILFHVHHVAFDGLGFLQLLRDWWSIYCGRESEVPIYDADVLESRCRPKVSFLEAFRLLPGQWRSIRAAIRVFGRKIIPLLPPVGSDSSKPVVPAVVTRTLSTDSTKKLRKLARSKNVSTNTMMASCLYVTIHAWQKENNVLPEGSHYRLVMPFNERSEYHESMSACNHCTVISFDRSPKEISDPESLLLSIDQEVRVIKRWRLSLNFWRILNGLRFLPGGIQKNASTQRVSATTLFSNLGRLDRSSDMFSDAGSGVSAVADVEFVPTLHHGMAISMLVYEVHGRMKVTMQYDSRVLEGSAAAIFMDQYVDSINEHLTEI